MQDSSERVAEQQSLFPDLISEYQEGRDEMNLAEFPIAALTNRVDPEAKTIVFKDTTYDKKTASLIDRKLTVSASDKYGLPTALDDEVILGLLQLSRLQGFRRPEVVFTRYQLLRILGWSDSTKNYRRLEEALKRWIGVTLYYENAWRDKGSGEWKSAYFHILDNVEIYKPGKKNALAPDGYCYFRWNEVVFKSLQAGNLKSIDFGVYRGLNSAIAKRMYRFLDKRFYQRRSLSFELESFAYEKLGLSRSYRDVAQLKRCLMPAIRELEAMQFLVTVESDQRFSKMRRGVWEVHFDRFVKDDGPQSSLPITVEHTTVMEARLTSHGVTAKQAKLIVSEFPEEFVAAKVEALEFLLSRGGDAAPKNPAGFLVNSIRENYTMPQGFKTQAEKEKDQQEEAEKKKQRAEAKRKREEAEAAKKKAADEAYFEKERRITAFLDSLTPQERSKLEEDAVKDSPFGGRLGPLRRAVIISHAEKVMLEAQQKGQGNLPLKGT